MARQDPPTALPAIIFDTDVLVHYARGNPQAADFVRAVPYPQRKIPAVAYMELLQGVRNQREMNAIRQDVHRNFSEVLPINESITYQAIRLVERYALTEGLRLADALIAATALTHGFQLATANERHYRFIKGLKLKIYRF